jgi:hypothetical protein
MAILSAHFHGGIGAAARNFFLGGTKLQPLVPQVSETAARALRPSLRGKWLVLRGFRKTKLVPSQIPPLVT